jgi:uncharacterized membrane protein YphA (DoxX/SURF4 family)
MDQRLNTPFWALRLAYGVVPIVAGLDKFTNLLTNWEQYVAPWMAGVLPFSAATFMQIVGVIEIAAGALVLSRFTRYAAYVVTAWLVLIALSLLTSGRFFDVAARDVVMAVGAFTLAKLAEVRAGAEERVTSGAARLEPARS